MGGSDNIQLEQVWAEYRHGLAAFLHSRVDDRAEVDDLLQDILIKTHTHLQDLHNPSSLKSWLFQVANNAIIDYYRKRSRARSISGEDLWYEQDEPEVKQALLQCVEPFIKALPPEQADLLLAIDIQGVSQKAYAEQLGLSYSTLKSRVQKARSELHRQFKRCCQFHLDARGKLMDFEPRGSACKNC